MASEKGLDAPYKKGLRKLSSFAVLMIIVLFGGGILWAARASIGGAVIAPGQVTVESNAKQIQHSEGGYVSEILIKEGDRVEAGDTLIRLDATRAEAELAIVTDQLNELVASEARLLAETADRTEFSIADGDRIYILPGEKFDRVMEAQDALLKARQTSITGQVRQLTEQIAQTREQIAGLKAQVTATDLELSLINEELIDVERLLSQGLVTEMRANALRRDKAKIEGERGVLIADIARARLAISEREVQKIRVADDARRQSLEQLQQIRLEKARLIQRKIAAEDRLRRLDIKTAQSGIVLDLQVHTVDGVIQPGEVLMSIVPREDQMVIEARVAPTDIDQVYQGQEARLMFSSFNMRTTPELHGTVLRVSPDVSLDEATGLPFYRARLQIAPGQLERLGNNEIIPGMPVDTFIRTEARTVAAYLIQPIMDHMNRAFREE